MPYVLPRRVRGAFVPPAAKAAGKTESEQPESEPETRPVDLSATHPLPVVAPRRVGETGLSLYPVGLAATAFGWSVDAKASAAILDAFAERGGTLIETSDSSADGEGQRMVGDWLRDRGNRDHLVLAARVGRHPDAHGLGPVSVVRAVDAALSRLGTEHLDLLVLDGEDYDAPLEATLATADWLVERGKVRFLAAAGFSAERLMEARILSSSGLPKLVAAECRYSLMEREFEGPLAMTVEGQSLAVLASSPLADGFLTGRFRAKSDVAVARRAGGPADYLGRRGSRVLAVLQRVAHEHGLPQASIALAWLLAKRNIVAPVVTVTAADEVGVVMDAAGIRLTRSQMLDLDRVS